MQFAIVESKPGYLEPATMHSVEGGRVVCRLLSGERATTTLDKIVHAGVVGDGNRPTVIWQWCPSWVAASMIARGYTCEAIAANPEGDEEPEEEEDVEAPKGDFDKKATEGWRYQSSENKWTPGARERRWKEQKVYRQWVQPNKRWTALSVNRVFGYHRVRQFIESYRRREIVPEAFFWCMVFAALTASENTKTAEANLSGFARMIATRRAMGMPFKRDLISFDEFRRSGSGFQVQRYNTLQKIFEAFPAIEQFLSATVLQDRALRRALLLHKDFDLPGLGVTKGSFALECYGQDVACLDRWMLRAIGAAEKIGGRYTPRLDRAAGPDNERDHINRAIAAHQEWWKTPRYTKKGNLRKIPTGVFKPLPRFPWEPFSDGSYALSGYGADRFSNAIENVIDEYEFYEDALKRTDYYRYALEEHAPNPLARAQWTMWEDVLLHHPRPNVRLPMATHAPLFFVIEGEGEARQKMRRAELLREDAARDRKTEGLA